ncbi:hypothetical protein MJM99_32615, partial [Salmonella enterica subsp. enterica serovar Kentucky]|nr:hypothetical protein [Salmonella enterica subsp. enterica serovar Kentucky]
TLLVSLFDARLQARTALLASSLAQANQELAQLALHDTLTRLPTPVVEEVLYPAMEDYQLDIMIGEGPAARSIKIDLPPFTLIGAT